MPNGGALSPNRPAPCADDNPVKTSGEFEQEPYETARSSLISDDSDSHPHEVPYEKQTVLYKLIGSRSFDAARNRLHTNKSEARVWIVTRYANTPTPSSDDRAATDAGASSVNKSYTVWYKRLPLHHLAERRPPLDLLRLLIDAHPDALLAKDENGRVPLVHAIVRKAALEAVRTLLEQNGNVGLESTEATDNEGRLPLHLACEYSVALEVINLLVDVNPAAVRAADGYGRLPLHWVCQSLSPKSSAVRRLVELYPESVRAPDGEGKTPLDLAVVGAGEEILEILREEEEG